MNFYLYYSPGGLMSKKNIYIVSDSSEDFSRHLINAGLSQFPDIETDLFTYSFVENKFTIEHVIYHAEKNEGHIFLALFNQELKSHALHLARQHGVSYFDLLAPVIQVFENFFESPAASASSLHRTLDAKYFDRIQAIEFAVNNDDGQNPQSFLEADIVVLGISRTSKTPLSIYLANMNYKVANLPLLPEAQIPAELYQVNPACIIGLTTEKSILQSVREERMLAYGMKPDTVYSNEERIQKELDFAHNLYEQLNCLVINVSNKSIEETASIILDYIQKK